MSFLLVTSRTATRLTSSTGEQPDRRGHRAAAMSCVLVLTACGGGSGGTDTASANNPPTVTAIADQTLDEDAATGPLAFSVGDVETPPGALLVTASSSNQTLIPDASLVVAGTDSNRTLAVRPAADQHGAATLTVHVSDGTAITTTTFAANVTPRNDLPTAVADGFSVSPGSLDAPLDVLGNDLDADLPNDALTITAVETPSAGGTVTNSSSQLLYTPASGFTGTETFSYTITDSAMATATATVTVVNPGNGLAHYWRLEESGSPYADAAGSLSASCVTCPAATAGLIGTGQHFDGVDDALSVGSLASLNWDSAQSFSIEFWAHKTTGCTGQEAVVGRADAALQLKWWLGCKGAGRAVFELVGRNGFGQRLTATSSIDDGDWHHVAGIRDAATGENRLYVDGVLEASATLAYPDKFTSQTAALNIGWLDDSAVDYHFNGVVDDVAIHTGVLSDADIARHYLDGSVGLRRGYLGCTGTVRIMPLGDSNTARRGYRVPLWFNLTGSSYDVDFVGSQADNCPDDPSQCLHDPDNEGHSGWTPAQIAASLNGFLGANPPDVILLHIGTNDLDLPGVVDILDITDSFDPAVTVVLARIINRLTFDQATTDFNIAVAAMAEQRISNGDKIIVVDMESALTYPDDMEDELHPLQVGYDKMAVVWRDSLSTFLPVCP